MECDKEGTIALLFVAVTMNGGTGAGYEVNILDLAPNFAGTVYGMINAIGSLPAFLAPMTVGALTNGNVSNINLITSFTIQLIELNLSYLFSNLSF